MVNDFVRTVNHFPDIGSVEVFGCHKYCSILQSYLFPTRRLEILPEHVVFALCRPVFERYIHLEASLDLLSTSSDFILRSSGTGVLF